MNANAIAVTRAIIGLAQGILLYLLYEANLTQSWPATGILFAPMWLLAIFVPVIIVAGLGTFKLRTLAMFVVAATVVMTLLAVYDIYRAAEQYGGAPILFSVRTLLFPSGALILSVGLALFISFSLSAAGSSDDSYARHFDVAWKLGVQLTLAWLFVGIFWLLLWLGAELFRLIQIDALSKLIKERWFAIPVTAMAFVLAMHLTDVQAGLVRGTRTLSLTLLAWLLPLMVLITWAFLAALPFTGLEPLWNTKRASALLLTAAIVLVFLINAAYQDGQPDNPAPSLIRELKRVAAVALLPLVALAAYGLMLRVGQYGWTPQRVVGAAVIAVMASYAAGYALAAVRHGAALTGLEPTNFAAAYIILVALFALLTPIADPARIAVADQLRRLDRGLVSPQVFDYRFLRFRAGRFGNEALKALAAREDGPNAAVIALKAKDALANKSPYQANRPDPATPQTRAASITVVHPKGHSLPDGFLQQDWTTVPRTAWVPPCLMTNGKCVALLTDLDGDEKSEILLMAVPYGATAIFRSSDDGRWSHIGRLDNINCPGVRDALKAGNISTLPATTKDVEANGHRLRVTSGCDSVEAKVMRLESR